MLWISPVWSDMEDLYCCEELLTGCECDFLEETLDFTWHFPLLKNLLHRARMSLIGPCALCIPNASSNITWPSKYTSEQRMLLCVEPGAYWAPRKQTGVGYGLFFCLSYTRGPLTDEASKNSRSKNGSLWEHFKLSAPLILKGHLASKPSFPQRWKELLNHNTIFLDPQSPPNTNNSLTMFCS